MTKRITKEDLDWGAFYNTHPDVNFFSALIGIDCDYLEDYYNEYKGRYDARTVNGSGLYSYKWELIPRKHILENSRLNDLETHYLIYLPDGMLPIVKTVAFVYGGSEYPVSAASNIQVIDDMRLSYQVFSLKIPVSYINITESDVTINEESILGIWIPEYYKDENYIEDHFGRILGIEVDREKYHNTDIVSFINPLETLEPTARVELIHESYSSMMKDLVLLMLTQHPSPANMLSMVSSVLTKYGVDINITSSVKDRVNDSWEQLEKRSLFIIEHNSYDSKAEEILARMIGYFKPVFTWAIIKHSGFYNVDAERDIIFDDISMYSNINMDISLFESTTVMQASLSRDMGAMKDGAFGSFDDNIEIIYISQYKE